jgi:hypothetical protein
MQIDSSLIWYKAYILLSISKESISLKYTVKYSKKLYVAVYFNGILSNFLIQKLNTYKILEGFYVKE